MMGTNRLMMEYKIIKEEMEGCSDPEIVLFPDEDNIYHWQGYIKGPPDTPYEGGHFQLDLAISRNYPISPPKIRFVTKIFHPNIHAKTGEICLNILRSSWSPAWMLWSTCHAIIALLCSPEPDSPLNCDAGNLLRHGDQRGFKSMARMYTQLCAIDHNSVNNTIASSSSS